MNEEFDHIWQSMPWRKRAYELADSYRSAVGKSLVDDNPREEIPQRMFFAPIVIVSHGIEADPILNYGNASALNLWGLSVKTLCAMPSRLTAEPMHRDERASMLERVARNGFIDDYAGVRIAADGRRFQIAQATVWNVFTADGSAAGQAATFDEWTWL